MNATVRLALPWLVALIGAVVVALGLRTLGADVVSQATTAADEARWDDALDALEAPAPLPPSATRLYDLGVAWYAKGEVPRAVAAWRAARELAPRNGDLVHNLAVARAELDGTPPPAEAVHGWMDIVTPGEVGLLATLAWAMLSWASWSWRRREEGLGTVVTAGLVAVVATVAALQGRDARLHHPIAVTLEVAAARDGADLDAGVRHELPPGSEVRAIARRGPFVLVEDGDARRGWVLADALAIPDPGRL